MARSRTRPRHAPSLPGNRPAVPTAAVPSARRVEFVPRFTPASDSVWYAVYRVDGSLRAGPAPEIGRALEHLNAGRGGEGLPGARSEK